MTIAVPTTEAGVGVVPNNSQPKRRPKTGPVIVDTTLEPSDFED
jgi:hypothetical protein